MMKLHATEPLEEAINVSLAANPSTEMLDMAGRMRSFTMLKWCGMPYNVIRNEIMCCCLQMNPRKMAKIGFTNSDVNKIQCVDCKITIALKSHLNFSTDEATAKKWLAKIKSAHAAGCLFKESSNKQFPLNEFAAKRFNTASFLVTKRKLMYVKWQEVLTSCLVSMKDLPESVQLDNKAIIKFKNIFFPDDFVKLVKALQTLQNSLQNAQQHSYDDEDEMPILGVIAFSGWRFLSSVENGEVALECPCCLRKVELSILMKREEYTQKLSEDKEEVLDDAID